MNEKNLDYLKNVLDNLGFGTRLNEVLENAIKRELPKFTLGLNNTHRPLEIKDLNSPKTDHMRFELNFNKAKDNDVYFLNNYQVTLRKAGESVPRVQTFDLERDNRITALQAYKLLSGLSLEKDIYQKSSIEEKAAEKPEKIKVWMKLNLDVTDAYGNHPIRTFYPEYQYNLEQSLAKYPIKGLDDPSRKEEVLKNLRYGNIQDAELAIGKKTVAVLIAANPQMKAIDIYDKNMREIRDEEIFPEKRATQSRVDENSREKSIPMQASSKIDSVQSEQPWKQEQNEGKSRGVGR